MENQPKYPSPALFFETVNGYQRTAAIKSAIELNIFTAIGNGVESASSLAQKCQTSERGMRIICDYLTIIGFLIKKAEGYQLTPDSAIFLNRNSPAYMGSIVEFLLSPMIVNAYNDLASTVRKGGTIVSSEGNLETDHPVWIDFAKNMMPMMAQPSQLIAQLVNTDANQPLKVLDISASHGLFGIAIAQHNANAEIYALDWEPVLKVAKENALAMEVSDRYHTIPGSAFDVDYGKDYDLVLLPNFLHHFDTATCEQLLQKVHYALADNGRVITYEFMPNEDRVTPPEAAAFSLVMLATTPSGDSYTFREYEQMFSNAGFNRNELHSLPNTPQQVVISYK